MRRFRGAYARCLAALLIAAQAAASGCNMLPSGNLGLQNDEIDQLSLRQRQKADAARHGPPIVDEQGRVVPASHQVPISQPPSEVHPISLPAYRIEPPDVLLIDAVRMAPKAPYYIQPLDILQVVVSGALPEQPINGQFAVAPDGTLNLGPSYGSTKVSGLTPVAAEAAITRTLRRVLQNPQVSATLVAPSGQQQIAGEHLVGPDGMVNLGIYGSVYISGLTVDEARAAIEKHLSEFFEEPRVAVDVFAYNSKVYYIITEGAGLGDQVVRVPVTGYETVLDAVAQVGGLSQLSSKKMWIARRSPLGAGCDQILPVDWVAVTKGGQSATNYQLLPGDRLFIAEDKLSRLDNFVASVTQPFERVFGFMLLGAQTIQVLQRFPEGQRF